MARLKSFTLMETLVALVLIVLSFSTATMIILNVQNSSSSYKKMRAYFLVREIQKETHEKKAFIDQDFSTNQYFITRKVAPHKDLENLYEITYHVKDKNKKQLFQLKEFIDG